MKTFGVTALYANEIRCKKCKRLLMKGEVQAIEIKCPKCGYVQKIHRDWSITSESEIERK
jgi:phage FluMu protein Com